MRMGEEINAGKTKAEEQIKALLEIVQMSKESDSTDLALKSIVDLIESNPDCLDFKDDINVDK